MILTRNKAMWCFSILVSINLILLFSALYSVMEAQGLGLFILMPFVIFCFSCIATVALLLIARAVNAKSNLDALVSAAVLACTNIISGYFILASRTYKTDGFMNSAYVVEYGPSVNQIMLLGLAVLLFLFYLFLSVFFKVEE